MKVKIDEDRTKYEIFCIGEKGSQALLRPYPDIYNSAITDIK